MHLAALRGGPITSVVPSTTATALTSLTVGVPPAEHGIVGYRIPEALTPQEVLIRPGDLLVITSDGIVEDHLDDIDFAASSLAIADQILRRHAKDSDDALVLAARHRGVSG